MISREKETLKQTEKELRAAENKENEEIKTAENLSRKEVKDEIRQFQRRILMRPKFPQLSLMEPEKKIESAKKKLDDTIKKRRLIDERKSKMILKKISKMIEDIRYATSKM